MPCGDQEEPQSPTCLGRTSTTGLYSGFHWQTTKDSFPPGRLQNLSTWWWLRQEGQASFSTVWQTGFTKKRWKNYFGTNLRERVQVLSDTRAIWFSPDGDKIAWTQFNDTDVSIRNVVMLIILEIINDNENYIPNFNIWIFFVVWEDMLKCNEIDILTNYSNCLNMT